MQTSIKEIYQIDLSNAYLSGDLNQVPTMEALIATLPKEEPTMSLTKKIYGMQDAPRVLEDQWTWIQSECELPLE
jgi:hypothetical protein